MNDIVKYDNNMNLLKFKGFTKTDMNLLMVLCSKMKDKDIRKITFSFEELKKLANFTSTDKKDFVLALEDMSARLMKVNSKIITDGKIMLFVLFPTFVIDEENETLTVGVNQDFTFLLNDLKQFTTFELQEFIDLKSKYAKNLYRILKQWRNKGIYTFHNLEEFRELMDIPVSYSNKIMMRDCVNPAIEEISKLDKSFQNFKCEPKYASKRGRPLEKLIFTWDTIAILPTVPTAEQASFSNQQTFEEYIKDYQGEDKPTPLDIKIAKDIQKNRHNKESKKAKKNAFNNFDQRKYDNAALEKLLFTDLTEEERAELTEQSVIKNEPKEKSTGRTSKKDMIHEYVLAHPNENVSQIAENLGISRTTVYKYMNAKTPKTPKQAKKDIAGTLEAPKAPKAEFRANTKPQEQFSENETPEQRKKRHRREWEEKRKQQK